MQMPPILGGFNINVLWDTEWSHGQFRKEKLNGICHLTLVSCFSALQLIELFASCWVSFKSQSQYSIAFFVVLDAAFSDALVSSSLAIYLPTY